MKHLVGMSAVLALVSGCVFEDRCAGGAVRDEASGRCVLEQSDGGSDAGERDSGSDSDAGTDAGGPRTIEDISVGAAHACVVDSAGVLTCWGANQLGQIATGDIAPVAAPRVIDLGARVTAVAGNTIHSCAQTAEPALYCWGANEQGQVGNGVASAAPVTTPFRIGTLGAARHFEGSFANTCFVSILSTAVCWGRNDSGQLGIDSVSPDPVTAPDQPVRSTAGSFETPVHVAVADRHVCFIGSDRHLSCMGNNDSGELGLGHTTSALVATEVPGMTDVSSVSVSASHTCAVNAGEVYCWGHNDHGQVQPGGPVDAILTPTPVAGVGPALQVATGDSHACALLDTGSVVCWGSRENGALGDGMPASATSVDAPVAVTGLTDVERLEASYLFLTCALTASNELYCWGTDASALVGGEPGSATVFLDGETVHTAPVRIDPFAP